MISNSVSLQHIHILADDKYKLAKWYEEFLGFKIIADIEELGEEHGPLFISADGGKTAISIFNNRNPSNDLITKCIPAFELETVDFLTLFKYFKKELDDLIMYDHLVFYSFYIFDPVGSKIELTSLQYKTVKKLLEDEKIESLAINPAVTKN